MTGKLIICATPIGNLGDVSARLQAVLAEADHIYAEDTRRAGTLLQSLGIGTKARSYFVGNEAHRSEELAGRLEAGDTVALISDAGIPTVADPGLSAVRAAIEVGAEVSVVPGPSAVTAALAVSGLPAERFVFEGFLPRRGKDRAARLAAIASEERTVILFAAKSRLGADLDDLAQALGSTRPLVVARELTKAFEEIWRGTIGEAGEHWAKQEVRGEFTLVIGGATKEPADLGQAVSAAHDAIDSGESMKDAVRRIAANSGISRRDLYEAVLRSAR